MGLFNFFKRKPKAKKIGLALGGGGARGFTHLGVLKAFEENGIKFDYVAGTSVGSLVGAFLCAGFSADQVIDFAKTLKFKDIKKNKITFVPSSTEGIENVIKQNLGDINFKDLKTPFCAVAVDIKSGKEVNIKSGNLSKAVAGSCAVPGVFNPVDFGNFRLMDGGLQNTIPSDVVKAMGADVVIAIDVNPNRGFGTDSTKYLDIIMASIRILMKSNAVKGKLYADIILEPDTKKFKSTKLEGASEMIQLGYDCAMEKMEEIKNLINCSTKRKIIKDKKIKDKNGEEKK